LRLQRETGGVRLTRGAGDEEEHGGTEGTETHGGFGSWRSEPVVRRLSAGVVVESAVHDP
jgi:hypothetical protein